MTKNKIYCEVTCGRCGGVAKNSGFYSPERIKVLKEQTKDWIGDTNYRVLCPDCKKELGR